MIKTYVIENSQNKVIEYFRRLKDAKEFMIKNFDQNWHILSISGQYFGEGFHKCRYYLKNDLTFKREKV